MRRKLFYKKLCADRLPIQEKELPKATRIIYLAPPHRALSQKPGWYIKRWRRVRFFLVSWFDSTFFWLVWQFMLGRTCKNTRQTLIRTFNLCGEVAERSKAHAWKACRRVSVSWVRIPSSPPFYYSNFARLALSSSLRKRLRRTGGFCLRTIARKASRW